MTALLTYADALAAVLAECRPLGTERVPLADAAGRVLAAVPLVGEPIPPFANSAMDGFAVAASDVPPAGGVLPLDAPIPAGTAPVPLRPGRAAPIATGAPLPRGADAVVPIEEAVRDGTQVHLPAGVTAGRYVRRAGSDLGVGPAPLAVGAPLDPAAGALLAAAGACEVAVFRRPRVAVLATGSELVPPHRTPGPAQIRESNSTALTWAYRGIGADATALGIAPDDAPALRRLLESALDADVVVTSAGVSVGDRDLVRGTLAELGVQPRFWGVDLKPGKPVAFGVRGDTPVLALPGNPASSLVCSTLLAEPAIRARAGWRAPGPRFASMTAGGEWPPAESRMHAVRCAVIDGEGAPLATPTGDQRSHRITSMIGADVLAVIEAGRAVRAGEFVRVTPA